TCFSGSPSGNLSTRPISPAGFRRKDGSMELEERFLIDRDESLRSGDEVGSAAISAREEERGGREDLLAENRRLHDELARQRDRHLEDRKKYRKHLLSLKSDLLRLQAVLPVRAMAEAKKLEVERLYRTL